MKTPQRPATLSLVRCAIYTRKSTEEGLEQEFNSLDAQRESGQAYIQSQQQEGWACLPDRYDDGGFTGGNTERPALQRLLTDIGDGKVDCVVIYKIDRLSRSLLDFAKMMDLFERQRVALVSVTQQFNSATSMGRLVLNVLLSFAQFEREIIAERTRDKIAATRRKGKWTGGTPILGYDVDSQANRLMVNAEEAEWVRAIFALYLEHQALVPVVEELERRGWEACPSRSIPAAEMDKVVLAQIRGACPHGGPGEAEPTRDGPGRFDRWWQALSLQDQGEALWNLVEKVDYDGRAGQLAITFRPGGFEALAEVPAEAAIGHEEVPA